MTNRLTNDLTQDEVRSVIKNEYPGSSTSYVDVLGDYSFTNAEKLAKQLLATLQENDRMRYAIRMLATHDLSPKQKWRISNEFLTDNENEVSNG